MGNKRLSMDKTDDFKVCTINNRLLSCERLTYKTIQEGMVILGRISQIHNTSLDISLPGRIFGTVFIQNISTPYSEVLENAVSQNLESMITLHDMFYESQFVIVKVIRVEVYNKSQPVTLSLEPNEVYKEFSHLWFKEDSIVSVAIKQREDHGYIADIGLDNCRCFLPFDEIEDFRDVAIGQVVLAVVTKCQQDQNASTIVISAIQKKLLAAQTPKYSSFSNIHAGMVVDFTITKTLKDGLEGVFLSDCVGYISESHLEQPLSTRKDYKIGKCLKVHVLYILPLIKMTFFTMMTLKESEMENKFTKIGNRIDAKILKKSSNGYFLKLNDYDKGFVNFRRLNVNLDSLQHDDLTEKLSNIFKIGSTHLGHVIDYNYMERVYICSFEKQLQTTKAFSVNNFQIGEKCVGVIKQVLPSGILVSIGLINGLVPNLHLSDFPNQLSIKKYRIGSKINVRVLEINLEVRGLVFTAKPSLVDNHDLPLIRSISDLEIGLKTVGFIVEIRANGLVISFFNRIKGFLHKKRLNLKYEDADDEDDNDNVDEDALKKSHFIGQVLECYVLSFDKRNESLQLTLSNPEKERDPIEIGAFVNVTIYKKDKLGLWANTDVGHNCYINMYHLTRHSCLAKKMMSMYSVGDQIDGLCCYHHFDSVFYLSTVITELDKFLKNGAITQSFVSEIVGENTLKMYAYHGTERIYFIIELKDVEVPCFEKEQRLLIRVINLNTRIATLKLPTLTKWFNNFEYGLNFLESYLNDLDKIGRLKTNLSNFHIGQKLKGTVVEFLSDFSCIIEVGNATRALCPLEHSSKGLTIDKHVICVVLWVDYIRDELIVSTTCHCKIAKKQDCMRYLNVGQYYNAEMVLSTKYFSLACLKGRGPEKGQFVVLQAAYNENEVLFMNKMRQNVPERVNILVKRITNKYAVGVTRLQAKVELKGTKNTTKRKSEIELEENVLDKKRVKVITPEASDNEEDVPEDIEQEPVVQLPGPQSFWNSNNDSNDFDNDDDDNDNDKDNSNNLQCKKVKLSASKKFAEQRKEVERLRKIESDLAGDKLLPKNADDFEKLLINDPDNGLLWLQYMSFFLQSGEIDTARLIGRRALAKINYRKENEKLKVWISLLNLENMYGSENTFSETLKEAAKASDALQVYSAAIDILNESNKKSLIGKLTTKKSKLMNQLKIKKLKKIC